MIRKNKISNARVAVLFLLTSSAVLLVQGCKDKGTMATTTPTTSGCQSLDQVSYLTGAEQTCCCNGTSAISPAPTSCSSVTGFSCPVGPAGVAETAGTLNDAAQAYTAGVGSNGSAGALVSSSDPAKNSRLSSDGSSAATAGGLGSLGTPPASTTTSATSPLANLATPAGSGSGGASGSGGSSPSSGTGSSANLSGNPTAPAATLASTSGASAVPDTGRYASGGGGMVSGRADLFGLGSDTNTSNGGGKADVKDLTGERAPASAAMGSDDPADYFTRLNSSDNIFKIVERKYTDKSKAWALSDAQALAARSTSPAKK